ncbi:hypothetical protein RR46_06527 [Papilio xuthus]|nr:hypothetical protein RR46_06527 [Papilio xuthus]
MSVIRTISYLTLIVTISALPIKNQIIEVPDLIIEPEIIKVANLNVTEIKESNDTVVIDKTEQNILKNSDTGSRNQVRPGMSVSNYDVEITRNGDTFTGRLLAQVIVEDPSTREDDIVFQVEGLTIDSVQFSMAGGSNFQNADFGVDDGLLEISTGIEATLYNFRIEYRGSLQETGFGLYVGRYFNDG